MFNKIKKIGNEMAQTLIQDDDFSKALFFLLPRVEM